MTFMHSDTHTCEQFLNLLVITSREIGWEEHLQIDLFCVKWEENLNSVNSVACIIGDMSP